MIELTMDLQAILDQIRSDYPKMSAGALLSATFLGWGAAWFLLRHQIATYKTRLEHAQEVIDGKAPALTYRPIRFRKGRSMIAGFGLLIFGLIVAAIGAGVLVWNAGKAPASNASSAVTVPALPIARSPTESPTTTVQWNKVFGTTRSVDLVFALFLDGRGPDAKSVKLKTGYLQSGVTGEMITMKVGSENPTVETFPISEANPIPPKGFIRLVAVMNSRAPDQGLPNKEFLDHWRKTWFHAIYEDEKPDDILFDENVMESYFPEIAGPHVTRKSP